MTCLSLLEVPGGIESRLASRGRLATFALNSQSEVSRLLFGKPCCDFDHPIPLFAMWKLTVRIKKRYACY
jgi:hypothetical protein